MRFHKNFDGIENGGFDRPCAQCIVGDSGPLIDTYFFFTSALVNRAKNSELSANFNDLIAAFIRLCKFGFENEKKKKKQVCKRSGLLSFKNCLENRPIVLGW